MLQDTRQNINCILCTKWTLIGVVLLNCELNSRHCDMKNKYGEPHYRYTEMEKWNYHSSKSLAAFFNCALWKLQFIENIYFCSDCAFVSALDRQVPLSIKLLLQLKRWITVYCELFRVFCIVIATDVLVSMCYRIDHQQYQLACN